MDPQPEPVSYICGGMLTLLIFRLVSEKVHRKTHCVTELLFSVIEFKNDFSEV